MLQQQRDMTLALRAAGLVGRSIKGSTDLYCSEFYILFGIINYVLSLNAHEIPLAIQPTRHRN